MVYIRKACAPKHVGACVQPRVEGINVYYSMPAGLNNNIIMGNVGNAILVL